VTTTALLLGGHPGAAPGTSPTSLAGVFPSPSFDPDAPPFPVPPGATLLNARILAGDGPTAARIAAWTSPLDFAATVAFYTGLADPRWTASGPPVTTPQSASLRFTDARGVFAGAELEIARTEPVRIGVVFSPRTPIARPPSSEPGPTIAFATLPPATALPEGFPARLMPAGGHLLDAAALAGTYDAIFAASADPATLAAAYRTALAGYASAVASHAEGAATVIDFSTPGGPGEIVLAPDGAGGTTVSLEVRP
jgi:hypothetical protein